MILFPVTALLGGIAGYWFISRYYTDNKINHCTIKKTKNVSFKSEIVFCNICDILVCDHDGFNYVFVSCGINLQGSIFI
jgi:hypothetical protein